MDSRCNQGNGCTFLHRIPFKKELFNGNSNSNNQQQPIQIQLNKNGNNSVAVTNEFTMEELLQLLHSLFPAKNKTEFKTLLAKHAMKLKPVVATLLQQDSWDINANSNEDSV